MASNYETAGTWILRAASLLLIVSASTRYFGKSATANGIAGWILLTAIGVGLVGVALITTARRRRPPAEESPVEQ